MLAAAGCSGAELPVPLAFEVSGRLEDANIREASGLARSQNRSDLMWIINDNGAKARVHAIDHNGARLGEFRLRKSKNVDWEDLASFRLDETPYLMVADIGDNDAKRDHRTLYFVEEPAVEHDGNAAIEWRVDYEYADGPRDSEAAAVDVDNGRVLILSKRDIPPHLYEVALQPESQERITATRIGAVKSLPGPSRQDLEFAKAMKNWYWQPVGMDISQDNRAAVILTYRAVFFYERQSDQDWLDALNTVPVRISLGNFRNAEAIAFGDNERIVIVTGENKHSRVLRIDLADASSHGY